MQSSYASHVIRIVLTIIVFGLFGFLGKWALTPESFGTYGHYRADAIQEEADQPIRHWTNASCLSCHPYESKLHQNGKHQTISCEFCHGPYDEHVKNNKRIAALSVKKKGDINTLCLRCHNRAIQARPKNIIKTVSIPSHLEEQKVKVTHFCNQCHHVHAPHRYIERAKKITSFSEAHNG